MTVTSSIYLSLRSRSVCLYTAILLAIGCRFPLAAQQQPAPALDTTSFVVVGEGLAAGMANYGLSETVQRGSFPALVAQQMKTAFAQPLIEAPGIGDVLGYSSLPLRVPTYPQTRVRIFPSRPNVDIQDLKPSLFVFNLSVPGMRAADTVSRRPVAPLVQRDTFQTSVNLILGFPQLILDKQVPLWTQLQYAEAMNPTVALVELGYFEALDAAISGDSRRVPDAAAFRTNYANVVRTLRALQAQVVVTTIPDPADTAYFTKASTALGILKATEFVLYAGYGLKPDDLITRNGLTTIGLQLFNKKIGKLPAGTVASSSVLADVRTRLAALNNEINNIAKENNAVVYDLAALFKRVRTSGIRAGSRTLTADYMGGFYSLDGYYPGTTGHALIANDLISFLNRTYGQSFAAVDLAPIMAADATLQHRLSDGRTVSASEISPDPAVQSEQ
jgi:hypothetical protein